MGAIDISKELKKYKKGWVAFNKSYKIIASASTFNEINEKIEKYKNKEEFLLFPASDHYFGFIT